ncbi:MAG: methylmalonyl Co-A mutase-associated GTPase MeaB [Burkholderiaceae bacterium]|nr:methylmalonyl Co-A mutase-associated GTPase MeaB [Burkholderiaceae bacterium]
MEDPLARGNDAAPHAQPATLLRAVESGDRRALARAASVLENGLPLAPEMMRELSRRSARAHVLGVTGAPGAGKSTLVSAVIGELLARGQRVAVLAVDPSSPITGGAVLGDRIRMGEFGANERVFIRSIASRGHLGGLSRTTAAIIDLFDAAGYDTIVVETVGAGQSEVEVASLADTSVVVCPPGLGDEVQASKAGILEIADLLVVTKGDLPLAERTMLELREMVALRSAREGRDVPVLKTAATRHEGVAELVDAAREHAAGSGVGRRRRGAGTQETQATQGADQGTIGESPAGADRGESLIRALHARDAFLAHCGVECIAVGPGTATLRMPVQAMHVNFNGSCHGGAIFTLADSAFGLGCNSHGLVAAGIDSHISYHQAVAQGDVLVARAIEISRSRRVCVLRVEVTRERDGASVAHFTGTAYLSSRAHPAQSNR